MVFVRLDRTECRGSGGYKDSGLNCCWSRSTCQCLIILLWPHIQVDAPRVVIVLTRSIVERVEVLVVVGRGHVRYTKLRTGGRFYLSRRICAVEGQLIRPSRRISRARPP